MKKETARDIAISLIAVSGLNFDGEAFDGCEDLINDNDMRKIIEEIQLQCKKMINKIEDKYDITVKCTTYEIVDQIMYE